MADRDNYKRQAAEQAASIVEDGMVVGLGTGSTAAFFIEALISRVRGGLSVLCIPTSDRSAAQAQAGGLRLVGFATHKKIDLCVDGADEIKRDSLDLVKGWGGALLREKIVAAASRRLLIIADSDKLVDWLGTRGPLPVEVTKFGWEVTSERVAALGADVARRALPDGEAYVTDGGNYILDCRFGQIADPRTLNRQILEIAGVLETGLFVGMTEQALVADDRGVTIYLPH